MCVALEGIGIEKLPPPEVAALDFAHAREIAHIAPLGLDHVNLVIDDLAGLRSGEQVNRCLLDTRCELAHPETVGCDRHGLRSLAAGPCLWANVEGGGQGERRAIPEGRMGAWVVVVGSYEDVEGQAAEQLA